MPPLLVSPRLRLGSQGGSPTAGSQSWTGTTGLPTMTGAAGSFSTPGSFVADTLTASNTGVPSGTSLTTQGSTTYTSANNGQTISNKWFTGRVTLDGAQNMTFVNCKFGGYDDYYYVYSINGALNNQFNYCECDMNYLNQNGVQAWFGPGWKLYRCRVYGGDVALRLGSNCEVRETLCHKPNLGVYSSHTNSLACFEGGSNILVEDSKFELGYDIIGYSITGTTCTIRTDGRMIRRLNALGGPIISAVGLSIEVNTFSDIARIDGTQTITAEVNGTYNELSFTVSATGGDVAYTPVSGIARLFSWDGTGGLTSAATFNPDFGNISNVTFQRNRVSGGSAPAYFQDKGANTVRKVNVNNNFFEGGYYTQTPNQTDAGIDIWYDNFYDPNRTLSTATRLYVSGVERKASLNFRLFSSTSPWNTPIPVGTTWYDHAVLHWVEGTVDGTPMEWYLGHDALKIYWGTPSDPTWTFNMPNYVAAAFNRNRSAETIYRHAPADLSVGGDSDLILALVDRPTGDYIEVWNTSLNSGTHTVASNASGDGQVGWAKGNVLTDPGAGTLTGANDGVRAANFSWLGGCINSRDVDNGYFDHALVVALPYYMLTGGVGGTSNYVAPATAIDNGYATGPIKMGSRIGIPASTPRPAGLSDGGNAMFDCLQTYGAFVGDFTGGQWPVLYADGNSVTGSDTLPWQQWTEQLWWDLCPLMRVADYQP